jgi:hypothetical protein
VDTPLVAVGFLSAAATVWASVLLIRAGRRDRRENRREELEEKVEENTEDIVHIQSHLEVKTGYRPRRS